MTIFKNLLFVIKRLVNTQPILGKIFCADNTIRHVQTVLLLSRLVDFSLNLVQNCNLISIIYKGLLNIIKMNHGNILHNNQPLIY